VIAETESSAESLRSRASF